jgi:hypothetical protein
MHKPVLPMKRKMFFTIETKLVRHGLEAYYEDFKEYIASDMKGKTSAVRI